MEYLGIENENDLITTKLTNLGYKWSSQVTNNYKWIFIVIDKNTQFKYGCLIGGTLNKNSDIEININDVPKRKDLDEYVKYLKEGNKMGLL